LNEGEERDLPLDLRNNGIEIDLPRREEIESALNKSDKLVVGADLRC
jgi:hypothetical protein